jgi:hypothetical protein
VADQRYSIKAVIALGYGVIHRPEDDPNIGYFSPHRLGTKVYLLLREGISYRRAFNERWMEYQETVLKRIEACFTSPFSSPLVPSTEADC